MIPMLSCLFCKRKRRLFKIYKIYGRTERPITSYIISFLGDVEEYLREDHGVCSACVFLLNKLIYLKNYMFNAIIDDSTEDDASYVTFAMAYKLFLHKLDKLNFEDEEFVEEEEVPDLLKPSYSTPCDSEINYEYSSDRNTPYVDKEVEKVFRKARRKRRKKSEMEEGRVSTPLLRYDKDGRLLNKRTRSVSRVLNALQEQLDTEHKDGFCDCTECRNKTKGHNVPRENASHHESLAKYWCYECRSGRYTSLDDFVYHKPSEEMTTFYRIDYNGISQNPVRHISQNTTGDFNVKVLVQLAKRQESPNLQFHVSPDLTSSEGTYERTSANSIDANSLTREPNLYEADLNILQEELSSETCNIVNRSMTPCSDLSLRSTVEGFVGDMIAGSIEVLNEMDSLEEGDVSDRMMIEKGGSTDGEESIQESECAKEKESIESRQSIEEAESTMDGDLIDDTELIIERGELQKECILSAFETERVAHDIIESSPDSEVPVCDSNDDKNCNISDDYRDVNYCPPKKELRVLLKRLAVDSDQLNPLKLRRKTPKTATVEYKTRQRNTRSSNYLDLETEIVGNARFPHKRISPSMQNSSSSTASVRSYLRSVRNRTFEPEVHPVRTDTEADSNDSEC